MAKSKATIEFIGQHFQAISDPRIERHKRHELLDIIVLSVLAVICGAEGWTDIEYFGNARKEWLKTVLPLKNGIPSHDTIARVFSLVDGAVLEECFATFMRSVADKTQGRIISLDGKTLKHSFDTAKSKAPIHVVSAWCSENGLCLGQTKTSEKSNEISAIPRLIESLDIEDAVITTDAMGAQKAIAGAIIGKKADYVLALKRNHRQFYKDITYSFDRILDSPDQDRFSVDYFEERSRGHGRVEIRRYWSIDNIDWLLESEDWPGFKSICKVEHVRIKNGKQSRECRYYISSLSGQSSELARAIRSHWGIENKLHWVLDVVFKEDDSRIRIDNAVENFSILRKVALNMIRAEPTKMSNKLKIKRAAWDNDFLQKIILA